MLSVNLNLKSWSYKMETYGLNLFYKLFGPTPPKTDPETNQIPEKFRKMEMIFKDNQTPLDFPITVNDLKTKVKIPKTKKHVGLMEY